MVAHRQSAALQIVAGVNGQLAVCCIGRQGLSAGASVTDEHVLTRVKAAESHRDPFDRLLLSVAEAENLVLLTADTALIALGRQEPRLPIRHA